MKNNYTLKTLISLMVCVLFALQTEAQIRLVNVDPASKIVTLKNFASSGSPVEVSGLWLCNFPDYTTVGSESANGSTNLGPGESVDITIISSSFDMVIADDEMGLYLNSNFGSPASMLDYMQWGTAGHGREGVANSAGVWTAGTFVNVAPPYTFTGTGTDFGVGFWETSLGINDITLNNGFTLSPNPTNSDVNLQFKNTISEGHIDIHDISGKLIYSRELENTNAETINASEWMQGIYLVTISTSNKTQTKRFVKQ